MKASSPIKVCYVCYREQIGTVIDHFSGFVADNGFDVTVVFCGPAADHNPVSSGKNGRKFYRITIPGSRDMLRSKKVFISETASFLNRNDFSIVHFHNSFEYFGLGKLLCSRKAKFIFHTTSHPVSDSPIRIAKRKAVEALQCLLMDAVIVQSEELKEELPIVRSLARSTVIPVGYNGRLFGPLDRQGSHDRRRAFGCSDDKIVLVYVGSMARFRRLDRLIEGFAEARRLSENLQLLMVGDGVAVKDLQAQAEALGIGSDVVFTGRVSHENVIDYLAAADIGLSFVPISRSYNYNPPLKTFELLACGMPVIATRTVSNSRIVTDGFNGVLVEDTAESLCRGIIRLTSDRSLQDHVKMNAVKSVADFDFEKITRNMLIPLYMKLLHK